MEDEIFRSGAVSSIDIKSDIRVAAVLRTHRHLKGPRGLCSTGGSPLTQREVQGLVARAARRANLVNVGVHIERSTSRS